MHTEADGNAEALSWLSWLSPSEWTSFWNRHITTSLCMLPFSINYTDNCGYSSERSKV